MHASAGASASRLRHYYLQLPQPFSGPMPVREIQDFGEWEEVSSEVSALWRQGAEEPPLEPLSGNYPARFANLSLINSISYVLAAAEQDREAVQGYLATLGAPNQLPLGPLC